MNAKLLVWDEMVDAGLPQEKKIVFWWRHDQPSQLSTALAKGYKTVLCPKLPLYFDFVQDSTHKYGRKWGKLYNTVQDVYSFSVDEYVTSKRDKKLIASIQASLWTETTPTEQRLDYLLFPRIGALAEVAWTQQENKNLSELMKRLKPHLSLYRDAGLYFYNPFSPAQHPEPVP